MESSSDSAAERAALVQADASRARLAGELRLPRLFHGSIGAAIGVQIGTAAWGVTSDQAWARWALLGGLALFAAVGALQLARFRRLNGVWVGGLASRVVLGTGVESSSSYVVALGFAVWAAFAGQGWLTGVCAVAGGVGYAVSGRRWWRSYRSDPAEHARAESALWTALIVAAGLVGLVLLLIGRR